MTNISPMIQAWLDQQMLAIKYQRIAEQSARDNALDRVENLSPEQRELLRLAASGVSFVDIGKARGMNKESVRKRFFSIQRILGVGSLVEAAVMAEKAGIV